MRERVGYPHSTITRAFPSSEYQTDHTLTGAAPFGIVQSIKWAFEGSSFDGRRVTRFSRFHNAIQTSWGMLQNGRQQIYEQETGLTDT